MPTYEYSCTACGEQLEVVQKFSDDPLTECPACHGRLRKLFSSVGVVFKGSGFYKTDSRSPSAPGPATPASTPSTPTTAGAEKPAPTESAPSTTTTKKDGDSKVA